MHAWKPNKWFSKCEQVVDLANNLFHTLPLRSRDAFEVMTPENIPLIIFDFVIFFMHTVKELREELTLLKEVRSATSG